MPNLICKTTLSHCDKRVEALSGIFWGRYNFRVNGGVLEIRPVFTGFELKNWLGTSVKTEGGGALAELVSQV